MSPVVYTPTELRDGWRAWSEATWQKEVIGLATMLGWTHYHPYRSYKSPTGFPDLVLLRERVVFAELKKHAATPKAQAAQVTSEQRRWLDNLERAGAEVYVWRPADLPSVFETLRRRGISTPSMLIEPS